MKEQNQDILIDKLRRLPKSKPDEKIWNRIEMEMAEEHNRETMKNTLRVLPELRPRNTLWDCVERSLPAAIGASEKVQLPQYTPPDSLWDQIEARLHISKLFRISNSRRMWISTAASIVASII